MKKLIAAVLAVLAVGAWAASEINVTASLTATKGFFSLTRSVSGLRVDMTGVNMSAVVQDVPTNAAAELTVGADVGNAGYAMARMITTNAAYYVEIGRNDSATNFLPLVRLYAGEVALFRVHPTATPYALANGGTVSLEWIVLEN
jgi:hypothetical protein